MSRSAGVGLPSERTAIRSASAVIPTRLSRPTTLRRALASARAQQGVEIEIIVVVNNVEPDASLPDDLGSDVRLITLPGRSSVGEARNVGAAAASNEWVGFLDDDDEWLPDKIARQLDVAAHAGRSVIVATRYNLLVDGLLVGVRPPHTPPANQDLSEWLLCSRWPLSTGAHAGSSSLLAHVDLLERCGFREMAMFQDHDWVLRSVRHHGAHFVQLDEPLTNYHGTTSDPHASTSGSWRDLERWVEGNPDLVTPRSAAAALLLTAIRQPDARRDYRRLVRSAFEHGRPHPLDLLASLAVVHPAPRRWRRSVDAYLASRRPSLRGAR